MSRRPPSLVIIVAALVFAVGPADTATPSSGSIPQPNPVTVGKKGGTAWVGPAGVGIPNEDVDGSVVAAQCLGAVPQPQCDIYTLTFAAADDFFTNAAAGFDGFIDVKIDGWQAGNPNDPNDANDIDLYVFDANGVLVNNSGNSGSVAEEVRIPRPTPNSPY